MKQPFGKIVIAAFLLFLASICYAQGTPGLHIYMDNAKAPATMTLAPGLYLDAGQGAMQGNTDSRAHVLRITQINGNEFTGSFEVLFFDETGHLLDLSSRINGSIGTTGIVATPGKIVINQSIPLTIDVQDDQVGKLITGISGHMLPEGMYLSWQLVDPVPGVDRVGRGGDFVAASEDDYKQVLALYKDVASYKENLLDYQTASANFLEDRITKYMHDTDQVLQSPPDSDVNQIVSKAVAVLDDERKLLSNQDPNGLESRRKQAKILAMKIDIYWSELDYIRQRHDKVIRYWQGRGSATSQLVWNSPCMESTSPSLDYGVPQACKGLADSYNAVLKRMREVSKKLADTKPDDSSMECIWQASQSLLNPSTRVIPPYCGRLNTAVKGHLT